MSSSYRPRCTVCQRTKPLQGLILRASLKSEGFKGRIEGLRRLALQTDVDWRLHFRHNHKKIVGNGESSRFQDHENRRISGNSAPRAIDQAFATPVVGFLSAPLPSGLDLGWRFCPGTLHQPAAPVEAVECGRPFLPYCASSSLQRVASQSTLWKLHRRCINTQSFWINRSSRFDGVLVRTCAFADCSSTC